MKNPSADRLTHTRRLGLPGWWRQQSRARRVLVAFAVAVWMSAALLVVWQYIVRAPETAQHADELRALASAIEPPPGVVMTSQSTDRKPGQVVVTTTYSKAPAQADVMTYYDAALSRVGWHTESKSQDGRLACYSQPPYWAAIDLRRVEPSQYLVVFSWGLRCQ